MAQSNSNPDAETAPSARLTLWEALFQAALDGLLILLYMTAAMVFAADVLGRPLEVWIWAIQGLAFAVFFCGLRLATSMRGQNTPSRRAEFKRSRWRFFALAGGVVAVACGAKVIAGGSFRGPMIGLGIAGATMALAAIVGMVRARYASRDHVVSE